MLLTPVLFEAVRGPGGDRGARWISKEKSLTVVFAGIVVVFVIVVVVGFVEEVCGRARLLTYSMVIAPASFRSKTSPHALT